MDRDEMILNQYKIYTEQKENFIDRNFQTNKFYMSAVLIIILAMIFTGNVVFMQKLSATLLFSVIGISVCTLWWMNVDSYNTLIKVKFSDVIEKLEESLPAKPYTDEFKGIKDFREKRVFVFSDIQKFIAVLGALFFFAVFVCEASPIVISVFNKISGLIIKAKCGI